MGFYSTGVTKKIFHVSNHNKYLFHKRSWWLETFYNYNQSFYSVKKQLNVNKHQNLSIYHILVTLINYLLDMPWLVKINRNGRIQAKVPTPVPDLKYLIKVAEYFWNKIQRTIFFPKGKANASTEGWIREYTGQK